MKRQNTFAKIRERERDAKREVIIEAAERLFAIKVFEKVSIRDIAAEVGISTTTIYRYFPDQQTLFVEAFIRESEEIINLLDDILKRPKASNLLTTMAVNYLEFLCENDHYFRMMSHFMLGGNLSPDLVERLNKVGRKVFDKMESVFKAAGFTENTRKLTHAFYASMSGIMISFYNYPGRERETVIAHMKYLATLIADRFLQASS